jgi:hypothetical protein
MALTEDNGMNTTMLVSPANGAANGFGSFGGDSWWIILLFFLLLGGGAWGMGGFGGMGNFGMIGSEMYPWMNQAQLTNNGFQNQMLNDNVTSIRDGISGLSTQICNSTGNIQNSLCNGFAGVNATINGGFANAETAANARQMANMQQAFASQTAITSGMNTIAANLQNCCCENRANIADLKYTVASENCADRAALSDGIRDVIVNQTANTQRILDQLCNDKIEQKNDIIAQLRSELMYARGQASQDVQTATIQAGQRTLANEVEQYVSPRAIPAYMVQNPNCCYQNACGCGNF